MTELHAKQHQPLAREKIRAEFRRDGVPREVMILAEYPHSLVVDDLLHLEPRRPRLRLFTMTPTGHLGWKPIAAALDAWSWP